jgi:hypothetical protein
MYIYKFIMSIATLKRKTTKGGNPRLDPVSGIGAKGFSLNGGYRNIGAVGQFRMVSNVTRTPFRGTQPMGHGGFDGEYYDVPSNSGDCCTNDNSIIKHSSLNTAGMLDEKYKWTKSQYPNYWVKDDDNANRITKTQGQLTRAKTWAAGACNFEKAANDDPDNVWKCKNKCVYWIGGKKKFLYYPYAKWLNTTKVQSQGAYITAGGVARLNRLPTPACMQHYPMMLTANGCDSNAVTWQQAQAQGLLPPDYMTCNPIDGAKTACQKSQDVVVPSGPSIPSFNSLVTLFQYIAANDPNALTVSNPTTNVDNFEEIVATETMQLITFAHEMYDYWFSQRNLHRNLNGWTLNVSAPRFPNNTPNAIMNAVYETGAPPIGYILESAIDDDGVIDVYFVWRGTITVVEWLQNSKFTTIRYYDGSQVHTGFYELYSQRIGNAGILTPRDTVLNYIDSILTRASTQQRFRVWCTGHSLGGALATLCCYDIIQRLDSANALTNSNISVGMYAHAAPRVGNAQFADYFNSRLDNARQHSWRGRISNVNDFVPRVRFNNLGYKQIKEHRQIEFGFPLAAFSSLDPTDPNYATNQYNFLGYNHSYPAYLIQSLKNLKTTGTYTRQTLLDRNIVYTNATLDAAVF